MLMRTSFTWTWKTVVGPVKYEPQAGVGRSLLGWHLWWFIGDSTKPLNAWMSLAWGAAVRRNPAEAIRAYNKDREDVDVDEVMRQLKGARILGGDGEN